MFGMGMQEIIIVLAIALIVIGPKKLPEIARSLGRAMGEFKKASRDLRSSFHLDENSNDVKKTFNNIKDDVKDTIDITPKSKPTKKRHSSSHDTTTPTKETGDKEIKAEKKKKVSEDE